MESLLLKCFEKGGRYKCFDTEYLETNMKALRINLKKYYWYRA